MLIVKFFVITFVQGVDEEGVGSIALKIPVMTFMPNSI